MSRKHFIRLAQEFRVILAGTKSAEAREAVIETIESVMSVCAGCNDRFDRNRFRRACGL
jgi:hypothetical protein